MNNSSVSKNVNGNSNQLKHANMHMKKGIIMTKNMDKCKTEHKDKDKNKEKEE